MTSAPRRPPLIRDQLEPMMVELIRQNRIAQARWGRDEVCASIELAVPGDPWMRVTTDTITLYYPADEIPIARLAELAPLPVDIACVSWEPQGFATLEFSPLSARDTAALIEDLITGLYEVPRNTAISCQLLALAWWPDGTSEHDEAVTAAADSDAAAPMEPPSGGGPAAPGPGKRAR